MTLPIQLTRFVGREAELAQATALLAETRLLTLTGPGGAGKTRLALQLASSLAERFPDGIWFVDLSSLSEGRLVWDQVAATLGVSEPAAGGAWAETVGRIVARRHALVVLDNCEHLVGPAALVTADLLGAAPELKIVATSREPLGVHGEVTWSVPALNEGDGFQLFTERAHQARPDLRLRDEDAETVRSICRRLDGLPLAIELAAARARAFTPSDIAASLRGRLQSLPSGPRAAPGRQATLRASFEWSYELLDGVECALLCQLSVFVGSFDLEGALAVCPDASVELLGALADRSLIALDDRTDQEQPRYRMLETVREFAAEHLAEMGKMELVRTRHRDHYLRLAETTQPLLVGPDEDRWRARLRPERDNFRAALAWSRDQEEPEELARLVWYLLAFWGVPGRMAEYATWAHAAYERRQSLSPRSAARILNLEAVLSLISTRDFDRVPNLASEALAMAQVAGDKGEEGLALSTLGLLAGLAGGADAMRPYMEKALPLARSADFPMALIVSLGAFMLLRLFQSNPDEARRLAEEAVAVAEARSDRHNRLFAGSMAGMSALVHGRLAEAARLHEKVVAAGRPTNDSNYFGSLLGLAWVKMFRGDFGGAREHIAEALPAVQLRGTDSVSITITDPMARLVRGWIELAEGDASAATETLAGVVAVARSGMAAPYACLPLLVLAEAQVALGEEEEAAAFLDEAATLARARAMTWILGRVARVRAKLLASRGELQEAESLVHEALSLGQEAGDQMGLVDALELLATLAEEQGSHRQAARLWGAAQTRRNELGYRIGLDGPAQKAALATARQSLGGVDFASAWSDGANLSIDEAIAYAARGRGERKRPATGWASLTPSELQVARLVGEHLSNPEIASRLFVSRATVKTHLVHIFAKLGIDSRSELAAQAAGRDR